MNEILTFATFLLPIVTAMTQMVKKLVTVPKKTVPAVAFFLGILIGLAAAPLTDADWLSRCWSGGLAGLSSTGLYELAFNKQSGSTQRWRRNRRK